MNIDYLSQLLGNRLNALGVAKEQAFLTGDLETINKLDEESNSVIDTINKLKLLEGISQTAAVTPFTEAEVVKNGIETSFIVAGSNIISDGQTILCLGEYDISSYATDPLHEEKISSILGNIGKMLSPSDIDTYIGAKMIISPVTGEMIFNAAKKYGVDIRLIMAIIEQDSNYGTEGVAVRTYNPGNVGNTGSDEKSFSSWSEGVEAVADWLARHRRADLLAADVSAQN